MRVAVLSGKGGTGKTLLATNLAAVTKHSVYVDCDVEEPNGRLFLPCARPSRQEVCVPVPEFDEKSCIGCRACVSFCQFNALAFLGGKPRVFREVCHFCGGCKLICKNHAVQEVPVPVGTVEVGAFEEITVVTGEMKLGEASGVPVIRGALKRATQIPTPLMVIDCPPGSACSVTESIGMADFCLLVTEPTPFGLHDLRMVVKLVKTLGKPMGVVINKWRGAYSPLEETCRQENLPILARIPYRKDFAEAISSGHLLAKSFPEARELFASLVKEIGGNE